MRRPIEEVIAAHDAELMAAPGVTAVYQGLAADGTPCVTVGVVRRTPELERVIPPEIEGWRVEIVETGALGPR